MLPGRRPRSGYLESAPRRHCLPPGSSAAGWAMLACLVAVPSATGVWHDLEPDGMSRPASVVNPVNQVDVTPRGPLADRPTGP